MNNTNDEIDKHIIAFIQGDIPIESRPYNGLADELGISEDEVQARILKMMSKGLLRRLGAVLRHQKAGFDSNAMVAWGVEEEDADEKGEFMAGYDEVSHCYLRETPPDFGYNLFTMIHARSEKELQEIISRISSEAGLSRYTIIKSLKEFKKTSMTYY
ncbi:MAG: Lrp/AsnC family transcriptional regulator [Syntrophomonadaceae bacterium]|nr:Lrp/AsnC family transcriptional regulator [Syntrophomonadaceae bacterium]